MPILLTGTRRALLQGATAIPSFVPAGSLAFADFVADRAWWNGLVVPSASPLTTSRASIGFDLAATQPFAANTPRRTPAGLLVEPAATNLLLRSQDRSSGWTFTQAASASSAIAAPSGTFDTVIEQSGSSYHRVYQTFNAAAATYAGTFILKRKDFDWVFLALDTSYANVNLATGAVGASAGGAVTVKPSFNGAYEVTMMATIAAGAGRALQVITSRTGNGTSTAAPTYAGDGVSGFYLWGVQVEQGAAGTSYIPTTTAAATRSADAISLTLPPGTGHLELAYDTGSTTTVVAGAGSFTIPANPPNANLKTLRATA